MRISKCTALVIAVWVIAGVAGSLIYYYFREHTHREATSPNGRYVALIKKRYREFPQPVIVNLTIIRDDGAQVSKDFDWRDQWGDIRSKSYPVTWTSNSELQIGDQWGSTQFPWKVSLVDSPTLQMTTVSP